MATVNGNKRTPKPGDGLTLPRQAFTEFHTHGIGVHPVVTMKLQTTSGKWVLAATDSGGCVPAIGRAVGFVGVESRGAVWSHKIDTPVPNSIHRQVVAEALVRFEMYRCSQTCDLLVAAHWLEPNPAGTRPIHRSQRLFLGRFGILPVALWEDANKPFRDSLMPKFYSRAGDDLAIPEYLHEGVIRITDAVCCVRCKHFHFADADPIRLPAFPPGAVAIPLPPGPVRKKGPEKSKFVAPDIFDPPQKDIATV